MCRLNPLGCCRDPGLILTYSPMLHVIPSPFQLHFLDLFNVLSIKVKINATKYIFIEKNDEPALVWPTFILRTSSVASFSHLAATSTVALTSTDSSAAVMLWALSQTTVKQPRSL